jgi:hypothetical protein
MAILAISAAMAGIAACSSSGPGTGNRSAAMAMPSAASSASGASARVGPIRITGAYIPAPASPDVAAVYLTIANTGSTAQTLTELSSDVTAHVMAMDESTHGMTGSMTDLGPIRIPAHGSFRFVPDHAHLMLEHASHELVPGDQVRLTVTFAPAGTVTFPVAVLGITGGMTDMPGTSMSPGPSASR